MKKFLFRVAILIVAVFFIVYCYIQVRTVFESAITTQTANIYTTESKTEAECYMLRNETVVTSPSTGVFNYLVKEGEKLSYKEPIADVYSSESDLQIHEKVAEINERIEVLENSSVKNSYLKTNISRVDSEIGEFISLLHQSSTSGEYSLAVQNKNDFLTLLNKRYLVVKSEDGYDELIEGLEREKDSLTASLSSPVATVTAPSSGYFYSSVDGYENQFNSSILENLTVDSFFEVIENTQPTDNSLAAGKIVTNFDWYTLCVVTKDEAVFYESGEYYDLVYPYSNGACINCVLNSKITQSDRDEVILVFKTDKVPQDFNFLRRQKAEIVHSSFTGLKISKDALRIVDGYEGVYVLVGNIINFKRCEKIREIDGFYIIDTDDPLEGQEDVKYGYLQMYDSVITGGKDLFDGKVIG